MDSTSQYIAIAAGMAFGAFQKHLLPKFPSWLIPVVNTTVGALVGHFTGFGAAEGSIIGLASVGGHQLVKQPLRKATGIKP